MKRGLLAFLAVSMLALGMGASASSAAAASQVVVTPTDPQGWCWTQPCADTRPGGTVSFVADSTAPGWPHRGALQLTTDLSTTAKAQAVHATNTPLANVNQLSYWTKQVSGPVFADPAYQLAICANGGTTPATCGFTTLVFEPYQNGVIIPGAWQYWNVAAGGRFWSTRTVTCSNGVLVGTPGGPATYTLVDVKAMCPEALVFQFIVNVGSNNPLYTVRTDLFNFNGTVYNFEPARNGCKDDRGGNEGNGDNNNCQNGDGQNESNNSD